MATTPPVAAQSSVPVKAVARAWVLESVIKGPDGKDMPLSSQLAAGQSQTITAQPGVQYKLAPAVKPPKGQAGKPNPEDSISNMQDGNDLRVMLPGGGLLLFKGFYANKNKTAPTKLQLSQPDGSEESLFSVTPATPQAKVQEIDSKALEAALGADATASSKSKTSSKEIVSKDKTTAVSETASDTSHLAQHRQRAQHQLCHGQEQRGRHCLFGGQ